MNNKFTITTGQDGHKRVTFYHVNKPNHEEVQNIIKKEFPRVRKKLINFIPGIVYTVITTSKE